MKRRIFSPEEIEGMANEYLNGASLKELAIKHRVTSTTVRNRLEENGVIIRSGYSHDPERLTTKQKIRMERNTKWKELYEAGATLQQISEQHGGLYLSTISKGIERAGGTLRAPGFRKGEKDKNKIPKGLLEWLGS